jgi:hypothetical protein
MSMLSPLDLDLRVAWHQEDLLHQAEAERLARALPRRPRANMHVRQRVAWLLHALADRLEPSYRFSGSGSSQVHSMSPR